MADRDPADLSRENAYLKLRNAQLQSDILDLTAETERLRGIQERLHARTLVRKSEMPAAGAPDCPTNHIIKKEFTMPDITQALAPAATPVDEDVIENGLLIKYGITKVPHHYYHIGGYRYTNLQDAVSQAKRLSHVA